MDPPNEYRGVQHGVCTYTAPHTHIGRCRGMQNLVIAWWTIKLLKLTTASKWRIEEVLYKYYATGDSAAKIYGHFWQKFDVE